MVQCANNRPTFNFDPSVSASSRRGLHRQEHGIDDVQHAAAERLVRLDDWGGAGKRDVRRCEKHNKRAAAQRTLRLVAHRLDDYRRLPLVLVLVLLVLALLALGALSLLVVLSLLVLHALGVAVAHPLNSDVRVRT